MTKGIYKIINKINKKVYIGESVNIERRFEEHINSLKNNTHVNFKLQQDWNEYGKDNFDFKLLYTLDEEINNYISNHILLIYENKEIITNNSVEKGYNLEYSLEKFLNNNKNLPYIDINLLKSYKNKFNGVDIKGVVSLKEGKIIKYDKVGEDFITLFLNNIEKYDGFSLLVYSILKYHENKFEFSILSINTILDLIYENNINKYNNKKYIEKSLKLLIEYDFIEGIYTNFISNNKIDIKEIRLNDCLYIKLNNHSNYNYTNIYIEDMTKIFDFIINNKVNKGDFFKFYLYIMFYINNDFSSEYFKLAFPSQMTICKELNISKNTCIKYTKIFKELKIIYSNYKGVITNENKNTNMYYCRWKDKDKLDNFIQLEKTADIVIDKKTLMNKKRSIKQKINNLELKINNSEFNNDIIEKLNKLKEEYKSLRGEN